MHNRVFVMMGGLHEIVFDMVWTPMGALTSLLAPFLGTIRRDWCFKSSVMLCCAVCLVLPGFAFAYSSHELYRQGKAATVLIVGIDDDTQSLSFGSGVFVSGDGLVLTNAHVIKDATRLFVYSQTQDVDTQPEILAVEPDWDLAALRVAAPRPTPFLSIMDEPAEEGDSAIAVGYPRLPDVLRMGLTIHPTVFPVTITGEAMGRSRTTGQPIPFAQITGFMNAGSSGGPLILSETGQIAGLVVHSVPYLERSKNHQGEVIGTVMLRAGLSYCIPATLLRTWLQKAHLDIPADQKWRPMVANSASGRQAATFAATAHLLHAMASVLHSDSELLDLSIHHYEAALRIDPARADVLRDLALAWVGKNDLERARSMFDRALALAPHDPALLTDAADLRRRLNMADAAAALYRAAIHQDACFARASLGLGVVLKGQGQMAEAAESFRRLAQCPPSTSSFAAYRLGLELEQQGQPSTALHVWNNFLRRAERLPSNELPILTKIRQRASQLRASVESSDSSPSIAYPASHAAQ